MLEQKDTHWAWKLLGLLGGALLNMVMMFGGGFVGVVAFISLAYATGDVKIGKPCSADFQIYHYQTGELCPTENNE